uniref:Putative secreted peptide n=1 Tax=Anopheles braziliensis TaxID=58242 RepID=A0A2M3ZVN0_9DIPT
MYSLYAACCLSSSGVSTILAADADAAVADRVVTAFFGVLVRIVLPPETVLLDMVLVEVVLLEEVILLPAAAG